jgi:hypothetical protein
VIRSGRQPRVASHFGQVFSFLLAILSTDVALGQVRLEHDPFELTIEGYANVTTASVDLKSSSDRADDDLRVDGAIRALAHWSTESGPDLGLRVVVETSPEDEFNVAEASVLIFGRGGRLEIGERQGLPDVLLGYAPNNFTFTGAEFGPASGPSLDPGGGLQAAFLAEPLASQLREMTGLGFASSLSDDRSSKFLYVSPKWRGWLAGVSYAADADDPRFGELLQLGVTHDSYWSENVLHVGGSYNVARAEEAGGRDLRSLNVGATLVLDYDWMLGASVTYDGDSGVAPSVARPISDAWGATVSVNYNRGPWTVGAFVQRSTREGDTEQSGDDQLWAYEAGLSYRLSTHVRIYGAWYSFDLEDEGGARAADRDSGDLFLVGFRAAL